MWLKVTPVTELKPGDVFISSREDVMFQTVRSVGRVPYSSKAAVYCLMREPEELEVPLAWVEKFYGPVWRRAMLSQPELRRTGITAEGELLQPSQPESRI